MTKKTKDVSELLGVSQTTIKRWASHYSNFFQKDRLGHYIFTEHECNLLLFIKEQVELGNPLDQISLPIKSSSTLRNLAIHSNLPDENDLSSRIREVERSLEQKADEVVSAQVLQHRAELDELRQIVNRIAATVETMQAGGVHSKSPHGNIRLPVAEKSSPPTSKRTFLRHFF